MTRDPKLKRKINLRKTENEQTLGSIMKFENFMKTYLYPPNGRHVCSLKQDSES